MLTRIPWMVLAVSLLLARPAVAQETLEGHHAAMPPCAAVCAASGALDAMDTRRPVPLLPMMADHQKRNMRDHLVAVQEIVTGLVASDFEAVERAAGRIGYSEQMAQMCSHMGTGAPGFTDKALAFHRTADTIKEAAVRRDAGAALAALGATLATCTGCHAEYRQQLVDEPTFHGLTGGEAPMQHGAH